MRLEFSKEQIIKKYNLYYLERLNAKGALEEEDKEKLDIVMEFNRDNITFLQLTPIHNELGREEAILEVTENIFDDMKFSLDTNGRVKKLRNIPEILEKWKKVKKEAFSNIKEENLQNLIFQISRLVNNEEQLTELLKNYSILPFIFCGIYNKDVSQNTSITRDIILHNIFPETCMPVTLTIDGGFGENNKKIFNYTGKSAHYFDRFEYLELVYGSFPALKDVHGNSVDVEINGQSKYDENNALSYFSIKTTILIKDTLRYEQIYLLKEKEENIASNDEETDQ